MIRRPMRPSFSPTDQPKLIGALRDARDWTIKYGSSVDYHSTVRQSSEALTHAIDDFVGEVTGDRTLLHLKPHGGNYSPRPPEE
jgi:hypothetical protein